MYSLGALSSFSLIYSLLFTDQKKKRVNDTTSSSRPMPSLSLIDEDEEMDYWGNEDDEEGYNDDDDHYVDVEDE